MLLDLRGPGGYTKVAFGCIKVSLSSLALQKMVVAISTLRFWVLQKGPADTRRHIEQYPSIAGKVVPLPIVGVRTLETTTHKMRHMVVVLFERAAEQR